MRTTKIMLIRGSDKRKTGEQKSKMKHAGCFWKTRKGFRQRHSSQTKTRHRRREKAYFGTSRNLAAEREQIKNLSSTKYFKNMSELTNYTQKSILSEPERPMSILPRETRRTEKRLDMARAY